MSQENHVDTFHAIMDKLRVMEDKLNRHSELLRDLKTMRERDAYLDIVETARLFRGAEDHIQLGLLGQDSLQETQRKTALSKTPDREAHRRKVKRRLCSLH